MAEEETKYKKGQKVLCYEPDPTKQPVIYHSEIRDIKFQDISKLLDKETCDVITGNGSSLIQPTYLIHFPGWGPRYDRWVTGDLILEVNEENLGKKKELDDKLAAIISKQNRKRKSVAKTPSSESGTSKPVLKFTLPATLKQSLERDFVNVTLRNLIIRLPRVPNTQDILNKFYEYASQKMSPHDQELLQEFITSITVYFDAMLPLQLLYKEERSQYEREGFVNSVRTKRQQLVLEKDGYNVLFPGYTEWSQEGRSGPLQPSTVYGIEHLLRLFVKLPDYLSHVDKPYLTSIGSFCDLFLTYVASNRADVFVEIQPYKEAELCDIR